MKRVGVDVDKVNGVDRVGEKSAKIDRLKADCCTHFRGFDNALDALREYTSAIYSKSILMIYHMYTHVNVIACGTSQATSLMTLGQLFN